LKGTFGKHAQSEQAVARSSAKIVGQLSRTVDVQNGIDTRAVAALLNEARRVIIAARAALF
jgi:hypothetical protein